MSTTDDDLFADEGAGYLVSVSDIMAGLLFVFIITLMAFVIQFNQAKKEQQEQNRQITNNDEVRENLLKKIEEDLQDKGITITVNAESGVLILGEDTVPFGSFKKRPTAKGVENLEKIAGVLGDIIPCYSNAPPEILGCAPRKKDKLEAIFIEGHTDSNPVKRRDGYSNWNLSSDRAIASFQIMQVPDPELLALHNSNNQPLFSVSGYAALRPRKDKPAWADSDARQRRIELRFIMTPPKEAQDIQPKRDLEGGGIR